MRLVARIVHARDHLRRAVLLLRELADDEVVLVVAGDGEHEVGRALDPGALEDEELGRVAALDDVLELLLERGEAVGALLDQRHLVARAEQDPREVRADLAAAATRMYICARLRLRGSQARADSIRASIASRSGRPCAGRAAA